MALVVGVGVGIGVGDCEEYRKLRAACPTPHFNNLTSTSIWKLNTSITAVTSTSTWKLNTSITNSWRKLPTLIQAHSTPPPPLPDYVPDSKFYKVEAIIRPWRIDKVSLALLKMGIRGVTVSDVRGFGAQGGAAERHAGSEFSEDKFVVKVKMEIVVSKDQVESVIDLIMQEARTGEIGDGKIFVIPVADVIRVRTGERGEQAERMSGGRHDLTKAT